MNDGENDRIEELEQGNSGERPATSTQSEVDEMYAELGIEAPKSNSKPKKRSKSTDVRTEDDEEDGDSNTDTRRKQDKDGKDKSKDAPATNKDDDSGNDNRSKKSEEREEDGKVSGQSKTASQRVQSPKSGGEDDSERGDEDSADEGAERSRQEAHESNDSEEEGKRPGKSNPAVEQRFQKLTGDLKERDDIIQKLQKDLSEAQARQQAAKVAQEDPEYKLEDFKTVQDEKGVVHELDDDQAELHFRRWKDGYDQRAEERNAEKNRQAAFEKAREEYEADRITKSVEAYDKLSELRDTHPELNSTSDKFDPEFSALVVPLLSKMTIYEEGTEPGNEDGNQPVIVGLKMDPSDILDVLQKVQALKRALPLNGANDNVEVRSNVNVPHSRSSDSTVNAANELMRELNINKTF